MICAVEFRVSFQIFKLMKMISEWNVFFLLSFCSTYDDAIFQVFFYDFMYVGWFFFCWNVWKNLRLFCNTWGISFYDSCSCRHTFHISWTHQEVMRVSLVFLSFFSSLKDLLDDNLVNGRCDANKNNLEVSFTIRQQPAAANGSDFSAN